MMIPARGEVPFSAGSRESILAAWVTHVEERKLNVRFSAEVKAIAREGQRFRVKTSAGSEMEAAKIVLAMGTQGNPRKLGVPGEDMPHVLYRLVDPAEHQDEDPGRRSRRLRVGDRKSTRLNSSHT